jgi:hypothetical protein
MLGKIAPALPELISSMVASAAGAGVALCFGTQPAPSVSRLLAQEGCISAYSIWTIISEVWRLSLGKKKNSSLALLSQILICFYWWPPMALTTDTADIEVWTTRHCSPASIHDSVSFPRDGTRAGASIKAPRHLKPGASQPTTTGLLTSWCLGVPEAHLSNLPSF